MNARSCAALLALFGSAYAYGSIAERDPLPGAWGYVGCRVDIDRTFSGATYIDDAGMTGINCINFCSVRGFPYAGTEWYHECWCGTELPAGATARPESECSTPCAGNATESCGGPLRLSVYHTTEQVGPKPNSGIPSWPHIGCYTEGTGGRTLTHGVAIPGGENSGVNCVAACDALGYLYAGTEFGGECFCGNSFENGGAPSTNGGCTMVCSGNSTEICGGPDRLNVYQFTPASTSTSSSLPPTTTTTSTTSSSTSSTSSTTSTTSSSTSSTSSTTSTTSSTTSSSTSTTSTTSSTSSSSTSSSTTTSTTASGLAPMASVTCPGDNGATYTAANGKSFTVECGIDHLAGDIGMEYTASYALCFEACAANPACNAFAWVPGTPGPCYMKDTVGAPQPNEAVWGAQIAVAPTTTSSTSASSTSSSTSVSSATSTSTSTSISSTTSSSSTSSTISSTSTTSTTSSSSSSTTSASSTTSGLGPMATVTCPGNNGAVYTATNGKTFLVECGIDHLAGDIGMEYAASYTLCFEACAANAACQAFAWVPGAPGPCYMKDSIGAPQPNEGVWGAKIVSSPSTTSSSTSASSTSSSSSVSSATSTSTSISSSSSVATTTTTSTTSSSTSSSTSTTTTAGPAPSGFPTGWTYQGCWADNVHGQRVFEFRAPDSPVMTQDLCARTCSDLGYIVSGVEFAQECFCGDAIIYGGEPAAEADCNMPCVGNPAQMCGAGNRLTVWSLGTPEVLPVPEVQTGGLPGSWHYEGCYIDTPGGDRVFPWQLLLPDTNSAPECLARCQEFGYMAGGLQYHEECYCGDPSDVIEADNEWVSETECGTVCTGNKTALCGGQNRLSVYYWRGDDPLYEFEYPTGVAAGEYKFLIGGVCIPLITQEGINGKIVFVEKWGTGPENSTGTYELDLELLDDFSMAWRPLHVKTDVFCAAGVTLPDIGGRHLNVGGWSGDSTFGVRLYWPDGEPGVWGTRDWEENVNVVSLQHGRWYPSGIILANGSVLVIGGEEGSNGEPVPTLEILPGTGTPPIYCDWLERTDPNNLYPFLAVLPEGGVFVAYWNEARILDENTFETSVILPNIPGSVHSPMSGRTYPLEGTGVLLPQHYPFTDPLGILICGGSTEYTGWALDNCVSIYPQAPNPTWLVERMPSRRVMSCIAPLPDGTYLILNGAHQGVAGFGLASDPNTNAVLYDPSKPEHHRMSVMANTTIYRMYHSEAITLLDGRVLVSGSDPEDGFHPQEYRVETFDPPYLLSGLPRPEFTIANKDWTYGQANIAFTLAQPAQNGEIKVSLLGAVSSTHGNSMGTRTMFPRVSCDGTACTVDAPPDAHTCTPGWYQMFVLDGGIPAKGVYVRIGGDPAGWGNWPAHPSFSKPGM